MPWVKLDEAFPDHRKVADLGYLAPLAGWLFVCGLAYCNRQLTDGRIPKFHVNRLAAFRYIEVRHGERVEDEVDAEELAQALVRVVLWHDRGDHYEVHDYLDYQPSREEVEEERRRKVEAGRQGGIASGRARRKVTKKPREAGASRGREAGASERPEAGASTTREAGAQAGASPLNEAGASHPIEAGAQAGAQAETKPDPDPGTDQDSVHPERSEGALTPVGARASRAPRLAARDTAADSGFATLCALVKAEWNACRKASRTALDEGDFLEHCKGLAARARLPYDSPTLAAALDAVRPGLQRQEAATR